MPHENRAALIKHLGNPNNCEQATAPKAEIRHNVKLRAVTFAASLEGKDNRSASNDRLISRGLSNQPALMTQQSSMDNGGRTNSSNSQNTTSSLASNDRLTSRGLSNQPAWMTQQSSMDNGDTGRYSEIKRDTVRHSETRSDSVRHSDGARINGSNSQSSHGTQHNNIALTSDAKDDNPRHCFICKKNGHWMNQCPRFDPDYAKKKKQRTTGSLASNDRLKSRGLSNQPARMSTQGSEDYTRSDGIDPPESGEVSEDSLENGTSRTKRKRSFSG